MDHDSNDSGESLKAALSTDVARTVFSFAPYWSFSVSWHCQHPSDTSPGSSFINFSEPQTSEEVLQLYRNRQMKGSNLVIGLSSPDIALDKIPPTFYRTLAYVFEVAKSGQNYAPLTAADLERGCPAQGWCEPLWNSSPEASQSQAGATLSNPSPAPQPTVADPAAVLFACAPFWCYLYNHEPSRAKKTPPKAAEQMLEMHRLGCLPPWTPVLGLKLNVSTFNSLPPSLFMPLGALLHLASLGLPCKAVGMEELSMWDKFKGSRTSSGCTQGVLQSLSGRQSRAGLPQAHGSLSSSPTPGGTAPALAVQNSMHGGLPYQGGLPHFYTPHHQQPGAAFFNPNNSYSPYPVYGTPFGSTNPSKPPLPQKMMWGGYGQYAPVSSGPRPYLPPHAPSPAGGYAQGSYPPTTGFPPDHANPPSYNAQPRQWQSNPGGRQLKDNNSSKKGKGWEQHPTPQGRSPHMMTMQPPQAAAPFPPVGGQGSGPASAAGSGRVWEAALFRLFTADATRGPAAAAWWRVTMKNLSSTEGPVSAEQMIIDYCQGRVRDSQLVCGTTSDVTANCSPPRDLFETVGSLLQQVEQGGHYVLVSLQEIQNTSRGNPNSHLPGRPSGSGVQLEPENSVGGQAKPAGFWCSSSSGTNSQRCSRDGGELSPTQEPGGGGGVNFTVKTKHSIDGTMHNSEARDQIQVPRFNNSNGVARVARDGYAAVAHLTQKLSRSSMK